MDVRKILQDLQYRINSTPESDPERGNAIRLRDRLLARLGLSLDDIIIVRTRRKFEKLTGDERNMLSQFFRKQFDREPLMSEPRHIGQYYEKAGILFPAEDSSEEQEPGFGLKEAMEAAAAMGLFMKFVLAFGKGTHSVKDRAAWLA